MEDYSLNCFAIAGLNLADTFQTRLTLRTWLALLTCMVLLTHVDISIHLSVYRSEFKLQHWLPKKWHYVKISRTGSLRFFTSEKKPKNKQLRNSGIKIPEAVSDLLPRVNRIFCCAGSQNWAMKLIQQLLKNTPTCLQFESAAHGRMLFAFLPTLQCISRLKKSTLGHQLRVEGFPKLMGSN